MVRTPYSALGTFSIAHAVSVPYQPKAVSVCEIICISKAASGLRNTWIRGALQVLSSILPGMALVVFLRGVNVGGHRTFRPSMLVKELRKYDVVNIGAAGTFIVRKPGSRAKFLAALARKLPFDTKVMVCDGRDFIQLAKENPFGTEPADATHVRFVSILAKAMRALPSIPVSLPPDGEWLVRLIASKQRFILGVYRRHMKTIGYLGKIDKLFGVPVTTRNWNTVTAILRVLSERENKGASSPEESKAGGFAGPQTRSRGRSN